MSGTSSANSKCTLNTLSVGPSRISFASFESPTILPISSTSAEQTTHLGDLLNIPHRLETQLNLTKGRHVTRTSGCSAQRRRLCGETKRTPSEHGSE